MDDTTAYLAVPYGRPRLRLRDMDEEAYLGLFVVAIVVFAAGCFIGWHLLWGVAVWLVPLLLVASGVGAVYCTSDAPVIRWQLRVAWTVLLVAGLVLGTYTSVERYRAEAPARAAADSQAAQHDATVDEITQFFEHQGFTLGKAYSSDLVTVDPDGQSGTIAVQTSVGRSLQYETLSIRRVGDGWVAGCQIGGQFVALTANHNELALALNQTGHCPAGYHSDSQEPTP
jgi:hypothetical protein